MTTLENIGGAKVNAVIGLSYVLAFFSKALLACSKPFSDVW